MKRLIRLTTFSLLAATLLGACGGGGKVYDPLHPSAIYTFGDGIVDSGQTAGKLYTVNSSDPSTKPVYSFPRMVASGYGIALTAQSAGGTAWGQGGSKIADMQAQVQAQLAAPGFAGFGAKDVIMISAGMEDLIAQTEAVVTGALSEDAAKADIQAKVAAYGDTIRQLDAKGAHYIYILPPYDLRLSPWMTTLQTTHGSAPAVYMNLYNSLISALVAQLESINAKTQNILLSPGFRTRMGYYTDSSSSQNNAGTSIANTALCAGAGATDASLCTDTTLITADAAEQAKYLFADNRHPVPVVLDLLAGGTISELKNRWGD